MFHTNEMISFVRIFRLTLLTQLLLFTAIKAEHSEYIFTIRDENGIEMQLKWTKTEQFLANENLPIFGVNLDQTLTQNTEIMEEIGDYETYHDLEKSSAVIFIKKSNRFFGVIDTKYLIVGLPLRKMDQVHVIGKSRHVIHNPNRLNKLRQSDVPSTSQQEDRTADKRPSEGTFNPDLPSTSRDNPYFPHEKRPRTDEIDDFTHGEDSTIHGSILRKFLASPAKPFTNQHSDQGSVLKKFIVNPDLSMKSHGNSEAQQIKVNPGTSEGTSDSNKLLKLLLQSPCVLPTVPKPKHLGTFYPEILIFVSYDIVKLFEDLREVSGFSRDHVVYIMIYMNAVSMLFGKLGNHLKIKLNIASIVFENEEGAFPFSNGKFINNQLITPNGDLVLSSIVKYINTRREEGQMHRQIFTEDAFDFFLYVTTFDAPSQEFHEENNEENRYHGVATESFDITEQRARLQYLGMEIKIPGAAVENSKTLESYVDAARELAHLMGTNSDYFQSDTIMSSKDFALRHQCIDCLKWSEQSVKSFRKYFSEDKNRCFLLNKPRSLRQYNVPMKTLSPVHQCSCYSLQTPVEERFTLDPHRISDVCMAPLPCIDPEISKASIRAHAILRQYLTFRPAPLPVDGTPCDVGKVCWQGDCVSTPVEIIII